MQCTCSPTIRQCPACLAWKQGQEVVKEQSQQNNSRRRTRRTRTLIRDGPAGELRYTYFSRETIEYVQQLFAAGIPNDVIAKRCGIAFGSLFYLVHMEVVDGTDLD